MGDSVSRVDKARPTHCVGCGDELTEVNAYRAWPSTDRWRSRCRPCARATARERYQSDPVFRDSKRAVNRSRARERYQNDPEIREKQRARRATPAGRETRRRYRADGGRSLETAQERERYQANREAINARRRQVEIVCEGCRGVFRGTRGLRAHQVSPLAGPECKPR